jgi:glycosyltransferase involved in cell wall biosynthesis
VRDIFPIDPKIGWLPFAVKKGIEICRTKKMHAIFATILPYTSALAAYHIAMRSNIPFIVDYRDLWQGKPDISHFSQWHDQFSTKWEQKILTFSAKAIINTQRAKETIQKLYPMIPAERFSVLYNGFDRHDFEQEVLNKDTNTLLFTYTGGFYGERTPAFFMQAIKELNETGELPLNVRFRFVGNYVQSIIDILSVSELKDFIELIPQVTHQKSVEFLLKSDFLLLFVAKRKSEIVIPAKFFEYLAAQKPILGMVPIQGEAAELIRNLHAGFVMEIDDIPQIKSHILRLCRMSKEEMRADLSCSYHKIKQFERKEQTKRLAEILNAHCR